MDTYRQIARAQVTTREPNGLNSTSPVEQVLKEIDRRMATALDA
jgi:hypothetical protein